LDTRDISDLTPDSSVVVEYSEVAPSLRKGRGLGASKRAKILLSLV